MQPEYTPPTIEKEAQAYWDTHRCFEAKERPGVRKFYCLSMFPYPSGRLHMGHVRNYTIGDAISRYRRMQGDNVMQPMGWDAFGLPAENAAIERRVLPGVWTRDNIEAMRRQLYQLGFGYDWNRELATCDPSYYRWEQWFFIRLFEKGVAYRKKAWLNWDPVDETVLANEQVIEGRGWRSGAVVEQREITQWFLRITDYAEQLLDDLEQLEGQWPAQVVQMQRNWIGRSKGAEICFALEGRDEVLEVFTTRPDTLLGVTYMALAVEHPLVQELSKEDSELRDFIRETQKISDKASRDKAGRDLGIVARHPLTGAALPVWTANFVLMEYGSGAVMSVPAHDQRDWEFAKTYDLPIQQVIAPADDTEANIQESAFIERGVLINSGEFDGLSSDVAQTAIVEALEQREKGREVVRYRLHDWGVSRQRRWGCPIPMIHCPECGVVPVPEEDLPVLLDESLSPDAPLPAEWLNVSCPRCGADAKRDTDTFDTFMESSWYQARFCSPDVENAMLDERTRYWLPADQYIGGIEHAILHLLYARFFHKLLRDEKLVPGDEPFAHLLTQGMVLKDGYKMSKSKGNVVDPEPLIERYGADTVRLFVLFASPPEHTLEWSDSGVEGSARFLKRLWRFVYDYMQQTPEAEFSSADQTPQQQELRRHLHATIDKASRVIGYRHTFNTAIAANMELLNAMARFENKTLEDQVLIKECLGAMLRMLAPIVPHITHALWKELGFEGIVLDQPWPEVDREALRCATERIVVQVNGKVRAQLEVPEDISEDEVQNVAQKNAKVQVHLEGKTVVRMIWVPHKLVNLVVRDA